MANTATLGFRGDKVKGLTQRGQHAFHEWHLVCSDDATYLDLVIDTLDVGGLAIGWLISNLTANGANTGVKFTPQMSIDGVTWTNIAWKDEAGSETTAGEATKAQNTSTYVMINFASYPELLCARYFRLHTKPSTNAASNYDVYVVQK